MFLSGVRQRSIHVYHLYIGGAGSDALEWQSLRAPRYAVRLARLGVQFVGSAAEADIVVVTGLLLRGNISAVLGELQAMPSPSVLVALGDAAISGGEWAKAGMSGLPGLAPHPLSYYADVQLTVPGNPPLPQAIMAAITEAARLLNRPPAGAGDAATDWAVDGE